MSETKIPLPEAGQTITSPHGIMWHVDQVSDSTIYLSRRLIASNPDTHGDSVQATIPVAAWDEIMSSK